jgi:hypothetical protein
VIDDGRQSRRDVVQPAGEQPHVVAALVRLHPDPVELPLDARRTGRRDCVRRGCGRGGEHRLHRDERRQPDVE